MNISLDLLKAEMLVLKNYLPPKLNLDDIKMSRNVTTFPITYTL